ncbi:MAG: hypothetical protein OXH76_23310 [Boseongicola sp.]|nr:hypothetical protein [Boseongicola sp.]
MAVRAGVLGTDPHDFPTGALSLQVSWCTSHPHCRSAIGRANIGRRNMFETWRSSTAIRLWRFTMLAEIPWSVLRSLVLVRSHSRASAFTFLRRDAEPFFALATTRCARSGGRRSMLTTGTISPFDMIRSVLDAEINADRFA